MIARPTRISLDAPVGAKVEALDEEGKSLGPVEVTREGERLTFPHRDGAESYLIAE